MSPVRQDKYPQYDVRKIIKALKYPTDDLLNILAHRGLRLLGGSTENSCSAIAATAKAGYEGIEIDVRLTKDGQAVVLHDHGLGRITNIQPPPGESQYNPFTGEGYSPLVKDTNWFGGIADLYLRDDNGNVTSEHPVLLDELLAFICSEGIHMLVQLDVKEVEAMPACYAAISKYTNAAGVPATEWCIWKCRAEFFPTPETWEAQDWVKKAFSAGHSLPYVPLYEVPVDQNLESIKAWGKKDYLLTFEMHVPQEGAALQSHLDLILSDKSLPKGVGSWLIGGDLPKSYYTGNVSQMSWDDSGFREDVLALGPEIPCHLVEWKGTKAIGGYLGRPLERYFDGRIDLPFLISQGFTYLVADPFDDLGEKLRQMGKRNISRMLQESPNV